MPTDAEIYEGQLAALEARDAEIKRLRGVLEGLSHIHDDNPSMALAELSRLEYARHMLGEVRQACRAALSETDS